MPLAAMTDAKARYEQDGFFLHTTPLFSSDLIAGAVDGMDAIRRGESDTGLPPASGIWKPGDNPNRLCKIEQPQRASRGIFDLISNSELGKAAAAVTGASMVQVWWIQLLYKPAAVGVPTSTAVGWHQDRSYWTPWEEGSQLFTAWIALSDVREDCGPMKFLRGSHCWGLQKGDFFAQNLDAQREGITPPSGEPWEEVMAILPPGGVSFHDNFTIHGSTHNLSGRPRRSLAVHLRTQASRPVGDKRESLTAYIDDPTICPVIYGKWAK